MSVPWTPDTACPTVATTHIRGISRVPDLAAVFMYESPTVIFDKQAAGQILSGKKLFFMGDSHIRVFLNSLLGWACNHVVDKLKVSHCY